ncbi:MAG: hypothetical protein V8T31_06050 [Lachnospiraceae bacterium]
MKKKKIKWIGGLLALCLMAEPTAVAMAKAESEVQETEIDEERESEESTETDSPKADSDKDDKVTEKKQEIDEETEIHPGERTATIVVVSITGNELTYYEVEDETETEAESESQELEILQNKETGVVKKDTQTDDVETEGAEGESVQKGGSMTPLDGMQQGDGHATGGQQHDFTGWNATDGWQCGTST